MQANKNHGQNLSHHQATHEQLEDLENKLENVHKDLKVRMRDDAAPMLDSGLSTLIEDLDARGMLEDTLVLAVGEFGRSPRKGLSTSGNDNDPDVRDHWPYCYTAVMAGAGIKRGHVHGASDETGSAPINESGVHPSLAAALTLMSGAASSCASASRGEQRVAQRGNALNEGRKAPCRADVAAEAGVPRACLHQRHRSSLHGRGHGTRRSAIAIGRHW